MGKRKGNWLARFGAIASPIAFPLLWPMNVDAKSLEKASSKQESSCIQSLSRASIIAHPALLPRGHGLILHMSEIVTESSPQRLPGVVITQAKCQDLN